MTLMESRLIHIKQAFTGYQQTGIPLIDFNGIELLPSFTADDIGIYVLIPKLAHYFNLSIDTAINLFFFGILVLPCLIGIVGFFLLYKDHWQRFIALLSILMLLRVGYYTGDVYLAFITCSVSIIPWFLYAMKRNTNKFSAALFFLSGLLIGLCHFIRAHTGTSVGLFIITYLILDHSHTWINKSKYLALLLCGLLLPYAYLQHQYTIHKNYVQTHMPDKVIGADTHVFWHNVYIGLGFLNFMNPDNICYDDSCAEKKVWSIDPTVSISNTTAYENILKWELWRLLRSNIHFFIFSFFAKIGILLYFLLRYLHVGLIFLFVFPISAQLIISFLIGLCFNALFGILTIPCFAYCLGFISFALLLSVVSINNAIAQWRLRQKDNENFAAIAAPI